MASNRPESARGYIDKGPQPGRRGSAWRSARTQGRQGCIKKGSLNDLIYFMIKIFGRPRGTKYYFFLGPGAPIINFLLKFFWFCPARNFFFHRFCAILFFFAFFFGIVRFFAILLICFGILAVTDAYDVDCVS